MSLVIAVSRESADGEKRVALVPEAAAKLRGAGAAVRLARGAGDAAGFPDDAYDGVDIAGADRVFEGADVAVCVRPPASEALARLPAGGVLVGFLNPYQADTLVRTCLQQRLTSFAVELIPRISRAQSMDALSSQAAAAGYKAALIAAGHAAYFFPMLTTAAGTVRPAKVLVIGAGVAGLQAIATCKRLGAQVSAYDVRPETEEQVNSLGARFVKLDVSGGGEGGYARELSDAEKRRQQELLADEVAGMNVVITTASVPGKPAPRILTEKMVRAMQPGSVIVDLGAEGGGNCELTSPGEVVMHGGVLIDGPLNLPSRLAHHASQLYARNLLNFLNPMIEDGKLHWDFDDQVIRESCLTHEGKIHHPATRERLGGDA